MSIEFLFLITIITTVTAFLYWQSRRLKIVTGQRKQQNSGRLTQQQRQLFLCALAKSPIGNVKISAVRDDFDSINFANELSHLLRKAGWHTSEVQSINFVNNPKGLIITVNSTAQSPVYASVLQRSFREIGLKTQAGTNSKIPENTLSLIVGLRPSLLNR